MSSGPLDGVRVIELGGLGAAPFTAMLLSDMGAAVTRVDRIADAGRAKPNLINRGRRSVTVDLKSDAGREVVLRLCDAADVLVEGFRPGVTERLGVGPEPVRTRNPRLVYARATGWGQTGPLADRAGHDIDYIALSGALASIGRAGAPPTPPLNLIGDFAGGGTMLAFGVVCALYESRASGRGQVIDGAMLDGAAVLMTMFFTYRHTGVLGPRGTNPLDSGAPFYEVYRTADDRWLAVGAVEPQFYAELLAGLQLDPDGLPAQSDRSRWPELRERLAAAIATRTRDEWSAVFEDRDACVVPVLDLGEVERHPHNRRREVFEHVEGVLQPRPAPRFERTPGAIQGPPPICGADTESVLRDCGFAPDEIDRLVSSGAVTTIPAQTGDAAPVPALRTEPRR